MKRIRNYYGKAKNDSGTTGFGSCDFCKLTGLNSIKRLNFWEHEKKNISNFKVVEFDHLYKIIRV